MKNIGKSLKEFREQQGLSLEEIADRSNINIRILRALEAGDEDDLPPRPYLRGFIQSYLRILKKEDSDLLSQFDDPTILQTEPDQIINSKKEESAKKEPVSRKISLKLILIILAALALTAILAIKNKLNSYEQEKITASSQPLPTNAIEDKTPQVSAVEETKQQQVSKISPKTEPKVAPEPEKIDLKVEEQKKITTPQEPLQLNPKNTSAIEPIEVIKKESPKETLEKVTPKINETKPPKILSIKKYQLEILALDKIRVQYQVDEQKEIHKTLYSGQSIIVNANKKIELFVNNGGSANIIFNKKDKGILGQVGKSLKLSFP